MAENKIVANNGSSIVLYSTDDGNIQLEVKLEKTPCGLIESKSLNFMVETTRQ